MVVLSCRWRSVSERSANTTRYDAGAMANVDWKALGYQLGVIHDTAHGWNETGLGGSRAIVHLLGVDVVLSAVHAYIEGERGHELEDAWIERLARDDDWHVARIAVRVRQFTRLERNVLPREAALRDVFLAANWRTDEDALAFLVAHLFARAPDTTIEQLTARLSGWFEAERTGEAGVRALAAKCVAT
jgi:hypothetical protein